MLDSGRATFSRKIREFAFDNANDGFDVCEIDTGRFLATLKVGYTERAFPKDVAYGEDSKIVVTGGDNGKAYVFDRKGGRIQQILKHGDKGLVQAIAVSEFIGA
jgi:hypothetical protein